MKKISEWLAASVAHGNLVVPAGTTKTWGVPQTGPRSSSTADPPAPCLIAQGRCS